SFIGQIDYGHRLCVVYSPGDYPQHPLARADYSAWFSGSQTPRLNEPCANQPPPAGSVLDRGIGQDRLAGFVLLRPQDDLALAVAEIVEVGAGDILKLHGHQPRFFPLALFAEFDVADDGLEGMAAGVIGDLVL